ncbi:DNA-binding protein DDB_G0278111-like isoform X2 [Phoenix dactylifera]|uniref:DNA-binding protein DDB_G0278111-like isoform X2 n=1 Tax=Phoenix dactylifera TaxID=42345 RepID=A0A8B9ALL8_PHODC|nr:DNA-binding protein DDB_G0278111-like isoform X2 [Phoenix dactylifera]
MDDPELATIRQRRMQELMAQHGIGNQQNADQQKAQEDAKREAEERRQLMLSQILSAQARERLARIALVKPEKARGVEDVLLRAAQMGQMTEKVKENIDSGFYVIHRYLKRGSYHFWSRSTSKQANRPK